MLVDICNCCDKLEECYEFMLAYAAQGLPSDEGSRSGKQIRDFLQRAVDALAGLSNVHANFVNAESLESAEKYLAFLAVLDRDARDSVTAIELVLAQPTIPSQLIDNLNASIHLRAVLTGLFLIGDILRQQLGQEMPASIGEEV